MQPWTREELHRFAPPPKARSEGDRRPEIHAAYIETLVKSWDFLVAEGFTTELRMAHFLATAGHETGGLTIVREECRWSWQRMCELWPQRFKASDLALRARHAACRGYEDKLGDLAYGAWNDLGRRLGNVEDGDGFRYRGGSWLQGTGRSWYREAGHAIGVDLEGDPDRIEDPSIALMIAAWYWRKHRLHDFADRNCLRAIQNQINRGNAFSKHDPIGWDSRQRWFTRAWQVVGRGKPLPAAGVVAIGAHGDDVRALQTRLRDLGYPCGAPDGIWGPECRRAIAAFKADWAAATNQALDPGEVVGPATRAALEAAEPIRRPERENLTEHDLAAAGSSEVAAGSQARHAGRMMTLLGGTAAAIEVVGSPSPTAAVQSPDPTPALQHTVGWVPQAKAVLVPVIDAVQWGLKHWWWVACITFGVWMYVKGQHVIRARVQAARAGLNLWR